MDEDTILTTDNAILDSIGEGDEQSTSESSVEQVDGEDTNTTEETSEINAKNCLSIF